MFRQTLALAFTVSLSLGAFASNAAYAEQCRDKAGKFIACPKPPAATKCRDITTKKFAKCGAPNTEPVPSK